MASSKPTQAPTRAPAAPITRKPAGAAVRGASSVYAVVPPDGGWGWLVVVASFWNLMVVSGNMTAFGIYLTVLREYLHATNGQVAFIGSLMMGLSLGIGPVVSALANRYGFRCVTILGSFIGCFGFGVSYFADNLIVLCFTHGIIGGIGLGLVMLPAIIICGFYFSRWRSLTLCIAVSGASVGSSIAPLLITTLLKKTTWQNSMLVQAGFMLSCAAVALVFRPLKPSLISPAQTVSVPPSTAQSRRQSRYSVVMVLGPSNAAYPAASEAVLPLSEPKHTQPSTSKRETVQPRTVSTTLVRGVSTRSDAAVSSLLPVEDNNRSGVRPMYRSDIFYESRLDHLPEYRSLSNSMEYNIHVTHSTTSTDLEQGRSSRCICCPISVTQVLATMLDLSLFKSPTFIILVLSGCLKSSVVSVPGMFITDRARQAEIEPWVANTLLTVLNMSCLCGRILCGIITSCSGVQSVLLNNVSLTIGAVTTIISGVSTTAPMLVTFCVVYGLALGIFNSLKTIMIVDLLGLKYLTTAYGLSSLFQGIVMMLGPPLVGWIESSTNSYETAFYFTGVVLLLAAVVSYPQQWVNKREKART